MVQYSLTVGVGEEEEGKRRREGGERELVLGERLAPSRSEESRGTGRGDLGDLPWSIETPEPWGVLDLGGTESVQMRGDPAADNRVGFGNTISRRVCGAWGG